EQNLMDHYSIPDHKEVIMENVDNKDAYTKNIQQSHEYQARFENKSAFDTISLDDAIKDILVALYTSIFVHKEYFDLLCIQDIYKR
ncbi:12372_t:CDS:2, partial [Entrophospora sp. SA101]